MEPITSQSAESSQGAKTECPHDPKQLLEVEKLKLEIAELRRSACVETCE